MVHPGTGFLNTDGDHQYRPFIRTREGSGDIGATLETGDPTTKTRYSSKKNRANKMTLAVLTAKLEQATKRPASQPGEIIRMFQPETVLRWHRELVRRKWTEERKLKRGRLRHSQEVESLMVICAAVLQTRKTDNFSKTKVLCL